MPEVLPPAAPLHLRVFVSSPGDVLPERHKALALIEALPREAWIQGDVTLQPVMWDQPGARTPMDAKRTPQESVNVDKGLPAECDLTIVILRGRLGSPPALKRPDGSAYASGTVWEYENALTGAGPVWVYRCTRKPTIEIDDPEVDAKRAQYRAVQDFFSGFTDAIGALQGGYWPYDSAEEFADLLHEHLQAFVRERLAQRPRPSGAGTPPAKPPYVMPLAVRDYDIVGRAELVERIWRVLGTGDHCSLVFLAGVGKTAAALELARDRARVLKQFEGLLWADLGRRPDPVETLRSWAEALGVEPKLMSDIQTLEGWRTAVRNAIGERRLLMVIDDVWDVKQARELAALGPQCVLLTTTRSPKVAAKLVRQDRVVEVQELLESEALQLLTDIAPHAVAADPEATRDVIDAVQGLPLALVLIGKYLKRESGERDPDRIREAFATLSRAGEHLRLRNEADDDGGGDGRTLAEIIDVSYGALRSDEARLALQHLAIFRPKPQAFGKLIAKEIAGAPSDMLYELSDVGLLEHTGGGNYTMHRVIAEYGREKLGPAQKTALHQQALAWYGNKLKGDVEDNLAAYAGWYQYEQADWQSTKDDWLYHLAASGDAVGSTLAFLRVYFDAFWWWGYYQRFPFCERLLREWRMREVGEAQRAGLAQLLEFQNAYPVGYDKRGNEADWKRVERALREIRRGVGLEGNFAALANDDARRVRSFTDFFLAECLSYGGQPDRAAALDLYARVHTQFSQHGGEWEASWVRFYVGEFLLQQGDFDGAREHALLALAEAGAELPLAERDPELPANAHRLLGDLNLRVDDIDKALAEYRRAAFYAFMFQAVPQPADTYTVAFYREICGRICAQLVALHAKHAARGQALARSLRRYWAAWWSEHPGPGDAEAKSALQAGDAAALEAALFPPVPSEADVIEQAPAFAQQVEAVLEALRQAAGIAGDLSSCKAASAA